MSTRNIAAPTRPLDANWTVNELLARHPGSIRVLNVFGVDSCCGGENSLAAAAADSNVEIELLLELITAAVNEQEHA